ncbi:MAG: anthranilate synthase component I family protein, partial [Acidimicrobiia bacterium]
MSSRPSRTQPTRDEFRALARDYSVVPLWREVLADQTTPVSAFLRLAADEPGFLLESVEHGDRWGRWSFVGRRPAVTFVARDGKLTVDAQVDASIRLDEGVLAALEDVLALYRAPDLAELPPLHSGVIGYLGYDVVREVEHLPEIPTDDRALPDAVFSVISELAAYDHWAQRAVLIANAWVPAGATEEELDRQYDEAEARLDSLEAAGARPLDEPLMPVPSRNEALPEVRRTVASEDFCRAVEVAKEHILAGDIFQVVLSQRFDLDPLDADPFDVYRVLRQVNPSPYMYFLRHPEVTVVGSSPEPMVQLLDGRVISRPIAGTRRRGATEEEDRRLGGELRENPKEVAEHVMLVDLARNDVGRVVRFGTETVDELMTLERYSHVMHLTSEVSGDLAEGKTPIDV